jgi:hypothetical protein
VPRLACAMSAMASAGVVEGYLSHWTHLFDLDRSTHICFRICLLVLSKLAHMPVFLSASWPSFLTKIFPIFVNVNVVFFVIDIKIPRFSFAHDHFRSLVPNSIRVLLWCDYDGSTSFGRRILFLFSDMQNYSYSLVKETSLKSR